MNRDLRRRFGQQVSGPLDELRQRTEHEQADTLFVERVMLAVKGSEADFLWTGTEAMRRTLLVCGALVALSFGWAVKCRDVAAPTSLATALPLEGPW
jgi:hypothetical protein